MKTFYLNLNNVNEIANEISKENSDISAVIGNFDGLHLAHQFLIKEASMAIDNALAVISFSDSLGKYNIANKTKEVLLSNSQKEILLKKMNVDYFIIIELSQNFLNLKPLEFIEKVLKPLNILNIFVGEDFRFGKYASGTPELLKEYFDVGIMKLVNYDGIKISSTYIKDLIRNGEIKEANNLLGYEYEMKGKVGIGNKLGRTIDFPTLNLSPEVDYVMPKFGVYKVLVYILGIPHLGIANVGIHPTIDKLSSPLVEVHVLDYDEEIYGNTIYVSFLEFVRDEKKFNSLVELKEQIKNDIKSIK